GAQIVELLDGARKSFPWDVEVWLSQAKSVMMSGLPGEALKAYEAILARWPDRDGALQNAGDLAGALNKKDLAVKYWRRAVEINPWTACYRERVGRYLFEENSWTECRAQCQKLLELDPENIPARSLLVSCLLKGGEKGKAREEFAQIEALRPPHLAQLRDWF